MKVDVRVITGIKIMETLQHYTFIHRRLKRDDGRTQNRKDRII